jgi:hypothetical protein
MQRQFSMFARVLARAMETLLGLSLILCLASSARAYEEQASLDLALGYAGVIDSQTLRPHLGSFDVGGSVGISDFLVLRAAVGYAFLAEHHAKTQQAGRGRLELAYLIDVLKWVPFLGLGVGVWGVNEQSGLRFFPTGHLLFGLDYLIARSFTLGADVRIGMLSESDKFVSWNEGQIRASFMFDLF